MSKINLNKLKKCPFCGHKLDRDNFRDSFHQETIFWTDHEWGREYHDMREHYDGQCWSLTCLTIEGGCGAEMHGDSAEEVFNKWQRRS